MGFPDVDLDKLDLFIEGLVDLMETHGPIDVGWSGETPKYQHDGFLPTETAQSDRVFTLEIKKLKIGRKLGYFWGQFIILCLPSFSVLPVFDCDHICP